MKTKLLASGIVAFSALFLSTSASALSVMEMESMSLNQDTAYIESGFAIEAPHEHLHSVLDGAEFDGAAQMANDTEGMLMYQDGLGKFDLVSLFALKVRGSDIQPGVNDAFALQIDGMVGGVSVVSKQLMTGTAGTVDFLSESALWSGLDEVQFWYASAGSYGHASSFIGDTFEFDALTAQPSAVPVPAAVWLFFSALGGLGVMRRKQAVA